MTADAARVVARWAIALTIILLAVQVWTARYRAYDIDEYEHMHATWLVARGQVPYRDFLEHHTPALYVLFSPLLAHAPVETDADAAKTVLIFARAARHAIRRDDARARWARRLAVRKGINKARVALARVLCDAVIRTWEAGTTA